jgi:hypothetical protein
LVEGRGVGASSEASRVCRDSFDAAEVARLPPKGDLNTPREGICCGSVG